MLLTKFYSLRISVLGVKACDVDILPSNESQKGRCMIYHENYPNTESICGDIRALQNKNVGE